MAVIVRYYTKSVTTRWSFSSVASRVLNVLQQRKVHSLSTIYRLVFLYDEVAVDGGMQRWPGGYARGWRQQVDEVCRNLTYERSVHQQVNGVTRVDVTRGGNWGCHPYFFLKKKLATFLVITVSQFSDCHPRLFSPEKLTTFLVVTVTFIDFARVSPPGGCHPSPFSPVRPRLPTILCTFAHKIFPLEGGTQGGQPPPLK